MKNRGYSRRVGRLAVQLSMNSGQQAGSPILEDIPAPLGLDDHELQSYFGIWQHPEGRFTHFGVGSPFNGASWVLVCPSKATAEIYIGFDAAENGRTCSDYEARRLSLPDAFDHARNLPLPIVHSTGVAYKRIGGVAVFDMFGTRFKIVDLLPL